MHVGRQQLREAAVPVATGGAAVAATTAAAVAAAPESFAVAAAAVARAVAAPAVAAACGTRWRPCLAAATTHAAASGAAPHAPAAHLARSHLAQLLAWGAVTERLRQKGLARGVVRKRIRRVRRHRVSGTSDVRMPP